ncbi:DUF1294 domain-containing protein [Patescibacteria group bacterium]|nr:DUF1294 domain-containing protein [Patescibacteria group bacterium]
MTLEQLLIGLVAAINIVAFIIMANDKRRSMRGGNPERISEGVLFFMAAAFGAIGVYTGMLLLRHKTRKWYFQLGLPLVILQNLASLYVIWILVSTN